MKYKLNRTLLAATLAATLAAAFAATIPSALLAQGVDTTKSKADRAKAAADTNPVRTFGGFVDTYYAWDANQPHNFDRANYAGEPKLGVVSGPNVSQFIQEAIVGYQLAPSVWLDGGIFFSHLGYEGWISRDNLAYSRSLVADFSPYYEAGVKLTWAASPKLTAGRNNVFFATSLAPTF